MGDSPGQRSLPSLRGSRESRSRTSILGKKNYRLLGEYLSPATPWCRGNFVTECLDTGRHQISGGSTPWCRANPDRGPRSVGPGHAMWRTHDGEHHGEHMMLCSLVNTTTKRKISQQKKLFAFKHYGFWQCMDTIRDKEIIEKKYKKIF